MNFKRGLLGLVCFALPLSVSYFLIIVGASEVAPDYVGLLPVGSKRYIPIMLESGIMLNIAAYFWSMKFFRK